MQVPDMPPLPISPWSNLSAFEDHSARDFSPRDGSPEPIPTQLGEPRKSGEAHMCDFGQAWRQEVLTIIDALPIGMMPITDHRCRSHRWCFKKKTFLLDVDGGLAWQEQAIIYMIKLFKLFSESS